ncbi:MAG: hypothetical protein SFU56_07910 [Capsulimonadales bacterium]|nr:hypothetical protein [Capsulimonadales bacterium]
MRRPEVTIAVMFTLFTLLVAPTVSARAQDPPDTEPQEAETRPPTIPPNQRPSVRAPIGTYPLPLTPTDPHRWRFTLAGPAPAFFQSRDRRPRRTVVQFPIGIYGGLGRRKGWGNFFLASDNLISTDAFDNSARVGLRLGVERLLYADGPMLTSEIGMVANQRGQNQALGATVGTRFLLPVRVGVGRPDLHLNFLGYENRRRLNIDASPRHTGRNVFLSSATLGLPPICFGQGDPEVRPHLILNFRAWFFANESAAPGYSPSRFESRYETALIIPTRAVRKNTPFLRAVAISFLSGANDANAYAPQRNFRFNLILVDTRRLLDEMNERRIIPKVPSMNLPGLSRPEEKPATEPDEKTEDVPKEIPAQPSSTPP